MNDSGAGGIGRVAITIVRVTLDDAAGASVPLRQLTDDEALQHACFKQEQAFIPTTNLEALVLKIIGGWEQLKATVNMYRFLEAGPDGEPLGQEDLSAAMNKLAKEFGLAWPHQRFAAKVNHSNQVRQKFAHFLFVSAIVGHESPRRILYFTRLGKAGDSYKAKRNALGLEWRDEEWAQQHRHEDSITEQEMRDTLAEMKELIEWCRALRRLAGILENSPNLSDDHPINTAGWWIPWRTEKEPLLVLGDLRVGVHEGEPDSSQMIQADD